MRSNEKNKKNHCWRVRNTKDAIIFRKFVYFPRVIIIIIIVIAATAIKVPSSWQLAIGDLRRWLGGSSIAHRMHDDELLEVKKAIIVMVVGCVRMIDFLSWILESIVSYYCLPDYLMYLASHLS